MRFQVPGDDGETYTVQVDACHAWVMRAWKWRVNNRGYVGRRTSHREPGMPYPVSEWVLLHRFLTSCPKGYVPDHLNGDTLDNRTANLEVVTQAENTRRTYHTPKGVLA